MIIDCPYKDRCSGCQLLGMPLGDQQRQKVSELRNLLSGRGIAFEREIEILSPGPAQLRDRSDLIIDHGKLGLYAKEAKALVDIEECQQFSPALQSLLSETRKVPWPQIKGSIRLRVGPHGDKGIWLDFANADIKALLDEKSVLSHLAGFAFVEIGQRHKILTVKADRYKLTDPEPRVWFQTWIDGKPIDLYCSIGSFTQPSLEANKVLIATIESWIQKTASEKIIEFGSGIGNLSLPALGQTRRLTACEFDSQSLKGLQKSLEKLSEKSGFEDCAKRLQLFQGDFQNKNPQDFETYDLILANPPRSGLKNFINPLLSTKNKPPYFIYMSCFPKSFVDDLAELRQCGYSIAELKILDQFPQTNHYEILCLATTAPVDSTSGKIA